jgi:ABC-type antimicrobial peptide transport system permease subunit
LPPACAGAARHLNLPVIDISTMDEKVSRSMTGEQLMSGLAGFFGAVALLLACIGLYGLMAYSVARRTAEIGVRMALGAQRADVLWIVLRETLLLVAAGIILGVPMVLATARLVATQRFGVAPHDPLTLAVSIIVLLLVGLAAGYIPARRATKLDSMVALRYE